MNVDPVFNPINTGKSRCSSPAGCAAAEDWRSILSTRRGSGPFLCGMPAAEPLGWDGQRTHSTALHTCGMLKEMSNTR
ncbi:hypothetical protein EYF80_039642 [Liparis tanakae]|uniref:Uncharacterized protein n=1 Tax=Liparis tanakae TaxID=230148 RepID=A0A4Z2GB58_9TELE|nr:hypothetical protein EYF80_039642 [Liparis tanakae]